MQTDRNMARARKRQKHVERLTHCEGERARARDSCSENSSKYIAAILFDSFTSDSQGQNS